MMNENKKRGRFIVFEGGDGCGKTTQAARLCRRIVKELGERCLLEREPDNRDIMGAVARAAFYGGVKLLPESLAYLHVADRLEHVDFMLPHLNAGTNIVCDRYYPSNMAYNSTDRLSIEQIYELNRPCFEMLEPDAIIFLEVPTEETARRRAADRASQEMFDADETQRRVIEDYRRTLDFLAAKGKNILRIDASLPEDEVADIIWHSLNLG